MCIFVKKKKMFSLLGIKIKIVVFGLKYFNFLKLYKDFFTLSNDSN